MVQTSFSMRKLALLTLLLAATATAGERQSIDDAWWTGPMLAPNGATLPQGSVLFEPYLYDVVSPHSNSLGNLSYLNIGVTDLFTLGLIPQEGFNTPSGFGLGDISLQAQYRLSKFDESTGIPTISAVVRETFPSGRYDRLGTHPDNGLGAGAYTTAVGFFGQTYFWMGNGRILRVRLDVLQSFSNSVSVNDVSVYGTGPGFRGKAKPGDSFSADASLEYSLTREWVLATDLLYGWNGVTRVNGADPFGPDNITLGSSRPLGVAPAVEYSWRPDIGVLVGVRIIPASRNVAASQTPAVAINMFF
jgi:hypothetical protein